MELTEQQKQEIIDVNLQQANMILREANLINKGAYAHPINKLINELNYLLSKKVKYNFDDEKDTFWKIVKTKHSLAAYLFYAQHRH